MKRKMIIVAIAAFMILTACGSGSDSAGTGDNSGAGDSGTGDNSGAGDSGTDSAVTSGAVTGDTVAGDSSGTVTGDGTQAKIFTDEDVIIEKTSVTSKAQFIPMTVDNVKMEVLAVKAPDDSIRVAFNTCQVCYDSGRGYYEQEGAELVCQNCGNRFGMSDVAKEKGGCNPVGIGDELTTQTDSEITVPLSLLKEAKSLFGNWKKA